MEVGELHFQRATAALRRTCLLFHLSPDWITVSSEASLAAKAFRAANLPEREAEALRLRIKAEDQLERPLEAGLLLEQVRGDTLCEEERAS